ncbi:hypothetical protein [Paraburkholderia sediminicola]|uniref:hypothetical protein n=1 Tax=Paraburkholderia sediminicola TaxID=458836 RepID=UPI0038B88E1E
MAAPDFSSVSGAVDVSSLVTAVLAVGALLVTMFVVYRGVDFAFDLVMARRIDREEALAQWREDQFR